ncbi:hypothetical protein FIM10_12695 [Sphingomonadales bacterium 56]|uniref:hypothetical protein n=1 Tax=unclassified Sphingobium TaxID=2611147 RepID=UPI00191B72B8|nr:MULTISPECIES: hypothetical protein [unclassified Sphingobium]MBY2929528.1 hypothetical protein [Sphingomonadales bacterium 56]MBY2958630.1 hypothetical protein [Sphingomonadales bacterium 58]CAD7337460.1 hypothetical protein SPHS8_01563 [Sphingobium sp. S8]CAD7339625.1 hypothetical protein SPHS6_02566 [Sphingobium sp. S6]
MPTVDEIAVSLGARCPIVANDGAVVTAHAAHDSAQLHHLPLGTMVVCAEKARDDSGRERVRIASPNGWVDAEALGAAVPFSKTALSYDDFLERHLCITPGDHYGLEFPIDLAGLRKAGPAFLTAAFHVAEVLSRDNQVTAIVALDKLDIRGASENGLLTVSYARDEPGLQTELFVKFPPSDVHHKYGLLRLSNGEIELGRLSRERQLPVTVTRYYFGDYSSYTGNYILITERVPFGIDPVEPAYRKGYDHEVPSVEEHYEVLTRNLARLVAAHKRGGLGYDIEAIFPFGKAAPDFQRIENPEPRLDRLIDFIGRVAPQIFSPAVTKPEFLKKWREDVLFGLEHKDKLLAYMLSNPDYTGLCHINLNIDNAWFWRDENGLLQAGILDWGGAGQASIAQALSGMLMMPEPDKHLGLVQRVIAIFIEECAAQGCPPIDKEELYFQYKASIFSTAIFMFVTILSDALDYFPEEYLVSLECRTDPRLLESGFYSAVVWIENMLREWLEEVTPGDVCRQIVARTRCSSS